MTIRHPAPAAPLQLAAPTEERPFTRGITPGAEDVKRAARAIGLTEAWVRRRLERGLPIGEAATTADAAARLASMRARFLQGWYQALARWQQQSEMIDSGLDPFDGGSITTAGPALRARALAELEQAWHALLDATWREAYRIGHSVKTGQAPTQFSDRLESQIANQKRFASNFARDVVSGTPGEPGRMSVGNRSKLYGNALHGAFNAGAVDGAAPEEVVFWRLGACDHCSDCPVLAVSGPYTRDTLPTLPRNGDTECRMNCCCYLEFVRRPGQQVNAPMDKEVPFVDAAVRPPAAPPGFRLPTDAERLLMRDMEQRVNYARRMIAQTRGTAAQQRWIQERRAASEARRKFLGERGIFDPPKFDVGEVVRGADVSSADVRDLTRVRGIDGRSVSRAEVGARADALTKARAEVAQQLQSMPPTAGVPDVEDLLRRAGAPPELFQVPAGEGVEPASPELLVLNAVGHGGRSVVRHHLAALDVLGAVVYDVEVGPVGDDWLELVLVGGTWIAGAPDEVRRFVEDWLAAVTGPPPAFARWTG